MSLLSVFPEHEHVKIISLPYRTGLWISESDQSGGDESDEAEKKTLESLITSYAQDFIKSEFVEEVMRLCVSKKDQWDAWAENLDNVLSETEDVIDLLAGSLNQTDMLAFKHSVMDIALTVATAFREEELDEAPMEKKLKFYALYYKEVAKAKMQGKPPPNLDHSLNISESEFQALEALANAMRIDLKDGLRGKSLIVV